MHLIDRQTEALPQDTCFQETLGSIFVVWISHEEEKSDCRFKLTELLVCFKKQLAERDFQLHLTDKNIQTNMLFEEKVQHF